MATKRPDSIEEYQRKKKEKSKGNIGVAVRKDYVKRIGAALGTAVESFIAVGKVLTEARNNLPHGQFEDMVVTDLGMDPSTAQRLMKIAAHPVLSKPAHGQDLPPSWRTLYELTKVPEPKLLAKLKDGTINPQMERKDVKPLQPAGKDKQKFKTTDDPEEETTPTTVRLAECPTCGGSGKVPLEEME